MTLVSAVSAFVSTLTEDAPNLAPAQEGAYVIALIEATYRSIREERIIKSDLQNMIAPLADDRPCAIARSKVT